MFNPFPDRNMACDFSDPSQSTDFLRYRPLTLLQLQLALIFFLTQFLHFLLRRIHLPRITSEILAGIILGPTLCGHIPNFADTLFPLDVDHYIDTLSKIGYIYFIFLSGVKMNPGSLFRSGASSSSAWTIGTIAALFPFTCGFFVAVYAKEKVGMHRLHAVNVILGTNNYFSFPVIFSLLDDLKIMNSELGRLALTSALISDLVSNTLLTLALNIKVGFTGWQNLLGMFNMLLLVMTICIIVALISRPLSQRIIAHTQEGRPINKVYVPILSAAVLLSCILADNTGLIYHQGPFVLGLALPDGPPLGSTIVNKLETIMCGLFAPLLVTICGLKVNLLELFDLEYIHVAWTVVVCCLTIKIASTVFPALVCKMPVRDAFALACIMCTQGIVQMCSFYISFILQAIDGDYFAVAILSVLLIASGMQLCVYSLYDHSRAYVGYQKRDIQHTAYNAELKVVVVSSRADDALAIKRILEASFSNRESPLAVYSLGLVELVGRSQPLLIDHKWDQKSSTAGPHVQKILDVFQSFKEQYMRTVSVQLYTAMSLPRFMHDDICSLAFDKMASFIILPFHKKWNNQGKMIADIGGVRIMNCNVLDMAPCSVGILVDRHRIKSSSDPSSTYNVAIVFVGGNDDREVLAYGKRMTGSPGIHLTVVRFVPWDPASVNQWDAVMDIEMLKEMRLLSGQQNNIVYREEIVKDGAETALHVHAMEDVFDLILVGRRHKEDCPQLSGLSEWIDLHEMGPIGDMLASTEINKPVSVLVIQQQILSIK